MIIRNRQQNGQSALNEIRLRLDLTPKEEKYSGYSVLIAHCITAFQIGAFHIFRLDDSFLELSLPH